MKKRHCNLPVSYTHLDVYKRQTIIGQFTINKDNTASVEVVSESVLVPGGHSVGVRMDVKGVLIVGCLLYTSGEREEDFV